MAKTISTWLVGICLAFFLMSGCGEKSEPPESEPMARQIISEDKTAEPEEAVVPEAEEVREPSKTAAEGEAEDEAKDSAEPGEPGPEALPEAPPETPPETSPETSLETSLETSDDQPEPAEEAALLSDDVGPVEPDSGEGLDEEAAPVIDLDFKDDDSADVPDDLIEEDSEIVFYNPFEPLFKKEQASSAELGVPGVREKREFLTPLEKIDIGQLKLEGIIRAPSGNRAIVADATGRGYVLQKGTYIGLNSGVVDKIEKDRVVVVEEIGDRQQKVLLKLQKPAGE